MTHCSWSEKQQSELKFAWLRRWVKGTEDFHSDTHPTGHCTPPTHMTFPGPTPTVHTWLNTPSHTLWPTGPLIHPPTHQPPSQATSLITHTHSPTWPPSHIAPTSHLTNDTPTHSHTHTTCLTLTVAIATPPLHKHRSTIHRTQPPHHIV